MTRTTLFTDAAQPEPARVPLDMAWECASMGGIPQRQRRTPDPARHTDHVTAEDDGHAHVSRRPRDGNSRRLASRQRGQCVRGRGYRARAGSGQRTEDEEAEEGGIVGIYMWNAKLYTLTYGTWINDPFDPGYCDEQFRRAGDLLTFALVRQRDGIVIACSRLTEAQTRALYAVIGREREAA